MTGFSKFLLILNFFQFKSNLKIFIGAAIEEGTLKPGDRLLEVNGVSVDGMSQSEVVALLRNAPLDSSVNLVNIFIIVSCVE